MTIRPASDRSLLISFGDELSTAAHRGVVRLCARLKGARGILNLHPAYVSVLLDFDPRRDSHASVEELVREACALPEQAADEAAPPAIEIPVRYGGEFGPDLPDVARHTGLSPRAIVELHASTEYTVYFLGFSPGFPYLGGLPAELATPRLPAPRKRVPAGSVAIGGGQTGIYPVDSPGGWRLIGRTSRRLFDANAAPPALLEMGGRLRFVPLPESSF